MTSSHSKAAGHRRTEAIVALLAAPGKNGVLVDLNRRDYAGGSALIFAASLNDIKTGTVLLNWKRASKEGNPSS